MNKGFAMPLVVFLIVIFLVVPLGFIFLTRGDGGDDVKGVSTYEKYSESPGILVKINSRSGIWDLYEYLCKTKDECLESLNSGASWGNISGGSGKEMEAFIPKHYSWDNYEFIKLYVRPGWGSDSSLFNATDIGKIVGSEIHEISSKGTSYSVLLVPLKQIGEGLSISGTFSAY